MTAALVLAWSWPIPARFKAATYGPVIFVRPECRADAALLAHERTHVRQFWRNPFFGLAYLFSKGARYRYELEAYRAQLAATPAENQPARLEAFAWHLANSYRLEVSEDQARADLAAGIVDGRTAA